MGSLGVPEMLFILVIALLVFGPRKMPEIGRTLGRALGELKRASNDFKRTLEDEVAGTELKEIGRDVRKSVDDARRLGRLEGVMAQMDPPSEDAGPKMPTGMPRAERSGPMGARVAKTAATDPGPTGEATASEPATDPGTVDEGAEGPSPEGGSPDARDAERS